MKVPFGDLKAQYLTIKKEIDDSINKVINESAFTKGKYVKTFEEKYADKCDVKNCIGVANGTECITGPKHAKKVVSILASNKGIIND